MSLLPTAVLLNDKYVVSGDGSPGLSITYPSPLEKSPIIYNLYLAPDHQPQTEELTISGPVTNKIHIQVCSIWIIIFLCFCTFIIYDFLNVSVQYSFSLVTKLHIFRCFGNMGRSMETSPVQTSHTSTTHLMLFQWRELFRADGPLSYLPAQ